ncbi:MAG: glycosyltransferase family 39 protein [Chloroflexi bacterium]|nr:glycosyltransferase family 39 protein [Chloroflexota bacterium]
MTRMTGGGMKSAHVRLLAITVLAFAFRLALLTLVRNPGINDPVHYYNLGRRLSEGKGFTINYVWHYARMPVELTHATDHWMPVPGVLVALGMAAGGANVHAALALFIVAGSLIPALVFLATKQLGQSASSALMAAAFAAVLPEFVLNSLRTDTTIVNMALVVSASLLVNGALQSGKRLGFLLAGVLFGLAHLTRNDSIILFSLLIAYLLLAEGRGIQRARRADVLLMVAALGLTVAPWHIRNLNEIGTLGSPQMSRMPFMVEPRDLYAYGIPVTFESMLERRGVVELIGKRIFELGAALKQMAVSLQLPLVFLVPAGVFWSCSKVNGAVLQKLLPALIWIVGILAVYPMLMPVHNQGGSFKKIFLTIMPLLIPAGAIAIEKLTRRRSEWRYAFLLISLAWLAWSSYDLVRQETANSDRFYQSMQVLVDRLEALPDKTGDGELRLMSQDPYVLSVFGYSSVVTPLASREDTLALARTFEIDYLLMPAARPALDPLYLAAETDPRFVLAAHLAEAGEIPFELYSFIHED